MENPKSSAGLTRRRFLQASVALPWMGSWLGTARAATAGEPLDARMVRYFDFSAGELRRLSGLVAGGLMEIVPVVQAGESDKYQHLGWPVATQLPGGRIVVAFKKKGGHHDEESLGDPESGRQVMWTDDLVQWQPSDPLGPQARVGAHDGMHCLGWTKLGSGGVRVMLVVSAAPRRCYISDDGGETWREQASNLEAETAGGSHCGPNFPDNAAFGPVVAFGQEKAGSLKKAENRKNYLARTRDGGVTWEGRIWKNAEAARSVEPALATWGPGHMVMVAREYGDFGYGGEEPRKYFYATQHVYQHREGAAFSEVNFTTAVTNIAGNGAALNDGEDRHGRSAHDTADVVYNPVSGRIEALQSHRWGGGGERTGTEVASREEDEISSLNLWSIDPDELLGGSAKWRFDGTLLERRGYSRKGNKDGLHPGGSVVDLARGMQHIFVYAGWRRSPSGIYRISRTLETERLRKELI